MTTYQSAGVDLESAEQLSDWLKSRVNGLFAGMVSAKRLTHLADPVLLSSIDGVGTKARLAMRLSSVDGLGADLVHHCVNDIAVHGAEPLFLLDYLAFHELDRAVAQRVIAGVADACAQLGLELTGGETAEMPLVYQPGQIDLVGAVVGFAERDQVVNGSAICDGDVILAVESDGVHTNGFSLIQSAFANADFYETVPGAKHTVGEELLRPHRCYLSEIRELIGTGLVHGLAHITGGGITGNASRIIPDHLQAVIDVPPWPAIFRLIEQHGVPEDEMARVFNLGVGVIAVCDRRILASPVGDWLKVGLVRAGHERSKVQLNL